MKAIRNPEKQFGYGPCPLVASKIKLRHYGIGEQWMGRRSLWTRIPGLVLIVVTVPFGIYLIGRFAIESWEGAAIVGAGFAAWLVGSLIWVYLIWPRLQERKRNSN